MIKKFLNEFKAFALRGNVVDMAIGVLIGGAFGNIVTALTNDVIQPILNCIGGGASFGWSIHLVGEQYILVGDFISVVINFIIYAFVIFLIMKSMNKLASIGEKKEEEKPAPAPEPSAEEKLLSEIRDLLKDKN